MSASALRRITAAALATASVAAVLAAPATAAPINLDRAEQAARAAVAPEVTEAAICVRASTPSGRTVRGRALCLLAHPAPAGQICRSLVSVRRTDDGLRTKLLRRTCVPLRPIEP
jgi:crotonobetainyl-CoA:carnitine CoA-transferase CaiB-like acyl-CoA transferase